MVVPEGSSFVNCTNVFFRSSHTFTVFPPDCLCTMKDTEGLPFNLAISLWSLTTASWMGPARTHSLPGSSRRWSPGSEMTGHPHHAKVRFPPPLVFLGYLVAALVLNWFLPIPAPWPVQARLLGGVLIVGGLLLGGFAVSRMQHAPLQIRTSPPLRSSSRVLIVLHAIPSTLASRSSSWAVPSWREPCGACSWPRSLSPRSLA